VAQAGSFKQVSDVSWEIPVTYKAGMRVPAKIYATRKLLDAMDAGVIEQVTNVACLPGIVRSAYAMADAHWGYGFPIGGVAAFDLEKGVISPGGIGFDINCLHPDSRVYDANGIWRRIGGVRAEDHGFVTFRSSSPAALATTAILKQSRWESDSLLRIKTRTGKTIMVTADHPIQTRRGMVSAGKISLDDYLLIDGVEGVAFTRPADLELVSRDSLRKTMEEMGITSRGNAMDRVLAQLAKVGLDRVMLSDDRTTQLLKILGLVFGKGTIPRVKVGQHVSFFGKAEDLSDVRKDLATLGFQSQVFSRGRHRRPRTPYGLSVSDLFDCSLRCTSTALAVLLVSLGAPYGKKTSEAYRLPPWLFVAEDWQKKLFLATFFGGELSEPRTVNGLDFQMPLFGVSKLERLSASAYELLHDFRRLLRSLGVETSPPALVKGCGYDGGDGPSIGVQVGILPDTENLLRFFGRIGYLYNHEKRRLAGVVSAYLAFQKAGDQRNSNHRQAVGLYAAGLPPSGIADPLRSDVAGAGSIQRSILGGSGNAEVLQGMKLEAFIAEFEAGTSGLVHDRVESIESVPYEGPVYDVTINDPNHNFIAEGIVVSNCGMRLIRTNLRYPEVKPKIKELVDLMFRLVPAGVGVKGFLRVSDSQFDEIMKYGVKWCAENGQAWEDDPANVEEGGYIKGADPAKVSRQARSRGIDQLGTLGSGNHYLEIQVVDPARYLDPGLARHFGIVEQDQVVVMVHCGSRGFGHQIGSDYLRVFDGAMKRYGLEVRDRELACAPFASKEGKDYYGAMVCAANMAFTNRQIIVQRVREAFSKVFHRDAEALDMHLIYDVCHNVAKVENHAYDGARADVLVHRKGATRSFGPGHPDIPAPYRDVGQPVIIGGSMETGSYLLLGTQKAMEETFGSTAHGSGRTMSRTAAKREVRGAELQKRMMDRGIYVKAATMDGLAEEAGMAYKDISEVVETMDRAGISKKVVALRPVGNIKG
jgi:tRNA-splicing ligase RtcB